MMPRDNSPNLCDRQSRRDHCGLFDQRGRFGACSRSRPSEGRTLIPIGADLAEANYRNQEASPTSTDIESLDGWSGSRGCGHNVIAAASESDLDVHLSGGV